MKASCLKLIQLLALLSVLGPASFASADEPKLHEAGSRFVLRISRAFISKQHVPLVDEVSPINRCLFGAHVTGESRTQGATTVNMDIEADGDTIFTFHFKGTTIGKTVAVHQPVSVYSTGTTNFEVQRAIRFDGLRFTAEPATYKATTSSIIDGVCTPRGLIGRIARSRAWASIRQNGPAIDAISLHDTKALVMASFDRETQKLVKDLNRVVPLEETLNILVPRAEGWVTRIARTKEYIIISRGPKDTEIPVLPKEFLHLRAPVERLREMLSGKATKVEGLRFSAVDDWWVIKVGEDLLEPLIEQMEEKSKPTK
jgi:hypothetical protein